MVHGLDKFKEYFGETFWQFIEDGGYEHREKSTGEKQFYRFMEPSKSDYPKMIELFSRKPGNFDLKFDTGLTPIHIDDSIISLSAILLNDVFRLLANVTPSSRMEIAEEIEGDIRQFVEMINEDRPDLKNLGLRNSSFDELMEILENIYLKTSES